MQKIISSIIACLSCLSLFASNPWVNIFYKVDGITRVCTNPCDSIRNIEYVANENKGCATIDVNLHNGFSKEVDLESILSSAIGSNIPSIYIDIDGGKEVVSKETYLKATIRVDGNDQFASLESNAVNIKGRGNTTWTYPKKPYRLNFNKKTSLCGLQKAKNFVLLANYIDNTLMRNVASLKMAELLQMPYTNNAVPVNLYINGNYRGSYMLTGKIGINSGSLTIDEQKGILLELDNHFDEAYKFHSSIYNLPVMIKDPDLDEIYGKDAPRILERIEADFTEFENAISQGKMPDERIDLKSLVSYLIVYNISLCYEILNPRSVYIYTTEIGGQYHFGPVWDFDWAYTYHNKEYLDCYNNILIPGRKEINNFWLDMIALPGFWDEYERQWRIFYDQLSPLLFEYLDEFSRSIRVSAYQNGEIWPQSSMTQSAISTETFDDNWEILRTWLRRRLDFLNTHPKLGLCN